MPVPSINPLDPIFKHPLVSNYKKRTPKITPSVYGRFYNDSPWCVSTSNSRDKPYQLWAGMAGRCYCETALKRNPTYFDCTVDPRWYSYIGFLRWFVQQDYRGTLHLDKDLLIRGNTRYAPETCKLIPQALNTLLGAARFNSSEYPTGVQPKHSKYIAKIKTDGKTKALGTFSCKWEAAFAYRRAKAEIITAWADSYFETDQELALALYTLARDCRLGLLETN